MLYANTNGKENKTMSKGDVYENCGCKWLVDDVYTTDDPDLFYKTRFRAHVIEKPEGYDGATEIDAALSF